MLKTNFIKSFHISDVCEKYLLICAILFAVDGRLNRRKKRCLYKVKRKLEKDLPPDFEPLSNNATETEVDDRFSKYNKKKLNKAIKDGESVEQSESDTVIDIEMDELLKDLSKKLNQKELNEMSSKQEKRKRALEMAEMTDKAFCEKNKMALVKTAVKKGMANLSNKVFLVTFLYKDRPANFSQARADWENYLLKLRRKELLNFHSCGTFGYGEVSRGIHRHELIFCENQAQMQWALNEWGKDYAHFEEIKIDNPSVDLSKVFFYLFENAMEIKQQGYKMKNFLSYSGEWETHDLANKYKQNCIKEMYEELDDFLLSHGIDALREVPVEISGQKATELTFYIPPSEWEKVPLEVKQGVKEILSRYRRNL